MRWWNIYVPSIQAREIFRSSFLLLLLCSFFLFFFFKFFGFCVQKFQGKKKSRLFYICVHSRSVGNTYLLYSYAARSVICVGSTNTQQCLKELVPRLRFPGRFFDTFIKFRIFEMERKKVIRDNENIAEVFSVSFCWE